MDNRDYIIDRAGCLLVITLLVIVIGLSIAQITQLIN